MINYSSTHLLEVTSCAVFVVDHDVFRKMEIGQMRELMRSSVVVDCKNVFDVGGDVVYLGIGERCLE